MSILAMRTLMVLAWAWYFVVASSLPVEFTWQELPGAVGPVQDERQCGATWAFAALGSLEGVCTLAGYAEALTLADALSVQQLLDCDKTSDGCDGGTPFTAYDYILNAGGLQTNGTYPYRAQNGVCSANSALFTDCTRNMTSYVHLNYTRYDSALAEYYLQKFLFDIGPLSVCLDPSGFDRLNYTGEVVRASQCGISQEHCVVLVGWTVVDGAPAWIAKNQWGTGWGARGFLHLEMGKNACNILGRGDGGYLPLIAHVLQRGHGPPPALSPKR